MLYVYMLNGGKIMTVFCLANNVLLSMTTQTQSMWHVLIIVGEFNYSTTTVSCLIGFILLHFSK